MRIMRFARWTGPVFVSTLVLFGAFIRAPASEVEQSFPSFESLRAGPLRVALLPGQDSFTFTMYGCPAELESLQAIVATMKFEQLGNGFDPGPRVGPSHQRHYDFLREVGWPVIGYAARSDHQVEGGTCRLSEEQDKILRILDNAGIFAATQLGEWGYYFHILSNRESWWHDIYREEFDQYQHLMKPKGLAGYEAMPEHRRDCYEIVRDYFQSRQRSMRGWNISVTGHSHYEAYVGQWGARMIGLELGENIAFTQSKIAFARGASRRTGKPWSIQVSPWFHGSCTTSGPLHINEKGRTRGLDAGHSLSFYERMGLHAWFAGTAMVTPENSSAIFFEKKSPPYRLTSHARAASRIFQLTQKRDRGIPWTPVAIVIDRFAGYNGYKRKPWGIFKPTAGDLELRDLLEEQLFPGSDHIHQKPFPDNPEASYLRPTKYGEIFDVQLSDAPSEVLSAYPVLLLAGDLTFDETFVAALKAALTKGNRLSLGDRHIKALGDQTLEELKRCGSVEILKPWKNPTTGRSSAISETRLTKLTQQHSPLAVKGDPVQYQINRNAQGWVIELVNNRGVIKFPNRPAERDTTAVANVTLHPHWPVSSAHEWIHGDEIPLRGNTIPITIPAGGTAFVELAD